MSYVTDVIDRVKRTDPDQPEFIQAVTEVLTSIEPAVDAHPEYQEESLLERLVEPERIIQFRVPWVDDAGKVRVNRGFRIQFNSALGPYKGGLRFHPTVNLSILKFLGFEQVFKNSLTTLPMGGAKGGSDFDPKGKSNGEVMRFCQSFMTELQRHIGPDTDVPAGDIGVGGREIGYLFGQYKRVCDEWSGVITGKGLPFGGSLARTQATGYGVVYIVDNLLSKYGETLEGKTVDISGSGNVAIYACEQAELQGARVVTMSDSTGWVHDPAGIDLDVVKQIKEVERGRISEYVKRTGRGEYHEGAGVWQIPCDVALPCATQNELGKKDAENLIKNGCKALVEGANMPTTIEATKAVMDAGIAFIPGKASNAGGVATSGLEMSQNSERLSWTFDEVNARLKGIMANIFQATDEAAQRYGKPGNYLVGANIAGFTKVADAMLSQGVC
jgi:glutamate dehydrogenase (NADP+)